MPTWVEVILEIIKITIPALVVFLTVYFVLKEYLDKQYKINLLDSRRAHSKTTLPLKLQAYERMTMFLERIAIPNLLFRLKQDNQNAIALKVAMLLAIQQEFEHNLTQQVYLSDQLWKIIKIARDDVVNTINGIAEGVDPDAPARELAQRLLHYVDSQEETALDKALLAIKKEASVLL